MHNRDIPLCQIFLASIKCLQLQHQPLIMPPWGAKPETRACEQKLEKGWVLDDSTRTTAILPMSGFRLLAHESIRSHKNESSILCLHVTESLPVIQPRKQTIQRGEKTGEMFGSKELERKTVNGDALSGPLNQALLERRCWQAGLVGVLHVSPLGMRSFALTLW